MTDMTKRGLLKPSAPLTTRATPGVAAHAPATPFAVPMTCVPIAGTSDMFSVRRINCIGVCLNRP